MYKISHMVCILIELYPDCFLLNQSLGRFFCFCQNSRSDENEDCFARLLSKHKSQLISSDCSKTENQDFSFIFLESRLSRRKNDDLFNRIGVWFFTGRILKNGTPKVRGDRAAGMTASLTWPLRPSRPQKLESSWVQRGKETKGPRHGRKKTAAKKKISFIQNSSFFGYYLRNCANISKNESNKEWNFPSLWILYVEWMKSH